VLIELNTDFSMKGLSAQEITAIVAAWQAKAISRDTMTELFRKGEVLPEGRTREEEERLIGPVPEVLQKGAKDAKELVLWQRTGENQSRVSSPTSSRVLAILAAALTFHLSLRAGTIRLSFLNDDAILGETIAVLTNNGCTERGTTVFRRAVERYYQGGFDLDLSAFPKKENGVYAFSTVGKLVDALPHKLCETKHGWDFNCFDTVIALAAEKLRIGLQPDENFGPFLVSKAMTNGQEVIVFAATARDAFMQMYQPWYRDATEGLIPKSMQDARICLSAALFRWRVLRMSTDEARLSAEAMAVLRADWRRATLRFPDNFEVVLVHDADFKGQMISTLHAGLLLHRNTSFTYVEKAGGSGPFVKLDFDDRADLLPWLSAFDKTEHRYAHLFATFNDASLDQLKSRK
jgi:hypothetical protein